MVPEIRNFGTAIRLVRKRDVTTDGVAMPRQRSLAGGGFEFRPVVLLGLSSYLLDFGAHAYKYRVHGPCAVRRDVIREDIGSRLGHYL